MMVSDLFAGKIEVQYGQFYIEVNGSFGGAMEDCFRGRSNGLCGAKTPTALFLITGLHTGAIGINIHLSDADPGLDESWEEIVEISLYVPNGEAILMEWAANQGVSMAVPAGSYRARYQGRAMEAASELHTNVDDDPVDTYRLDLWPAPHAPDRIVKQTSSVAAYWHNWAGELAMPAS